MEGEDNLELLMIPRTTLPMKINQSNLHLGQHRFRRRP